MLGKTLWDNSGGSSGDIAIRRNTGIFEIPTLVLAEILKRWFERNSSKNSDR